MKRKLAVLAICISVVLAAQLTKPNGGGGGGGSSLVAGTDYARPAQSGTFANLPTCDNTTNTVFYRFTNSFYDGAFCPADGSDWQYFLNGRTVTPPVNGNFSWVNQGGATVTTTNGGVFLLAPTASGNNIRMRCETAPAKPWTRTIDFVPLLHTASTPYVGLAVRDSTSGKLITMTIGELSGSVYTMSLINWTNETTFSAYSHQQLVKATIGKTAQFSVANNGSNNLVWSYSNDGVNLETWTTFGDTAFLSAAPNQVCFIANSSSTSNTAGITVLSWN